MDSIKFFRVETGREPDVAFQLTEAPSQAPGPWRVVVRNQGPGAVLVGTVGGPFGFILDENEEETFDDLPTQPWLAVRPAERDAAVVSGYVQRVMRAKPELRTVDGHPGVSILGEWP